MSKFGIFGLSLALLVGAASTASAWNDKGHMVIARLAWQELKAEERAKVVEFLKSHPHYNEFLKEKKPDNFAEDEWVFLRAATWADWVRSHHTKEYHVGERHYINYPLSSPGSTVKGPQPDLDKENIVSGISKQFAVATIGGDQKERAVAITWLFHLTGDIHQPLHAVALFNETFPMGDRGGNLSTVKVAGGGVIQMHSFWDGLLGSGTDRTAILDTVKEATDAAADDAGVKKELGDNKTPESWAKESAAVAQKVVYQDGTLKPANTQDRPKEADIPTTDEGYGKKAGETARLAAYKGGKRLATLLRKVVAANE